MASAAAVSIDEDLICGVQVDQQATADHLAAIDQTLQGWSSVVFASKDSSIFITDKGEVTPVSGIRGTSSAANICGTNGHLYIPSNMIEVDKIVKLSQNNAYMGKQLVWKVTQPAADGIFASNEVIFGRFAVIKNESNPTATTVVGCVSIGNHFPTLCKFEDIQKPVAICEVNYAAGPPTDLTIRRSDVAVLIKQCRDALAEVRRLSSRALKRMIYSNPRNIDSDSPGIEKKKICIFGIQVKIFPSSPKSSNFTLVNPSLFPTFLANAKALLNYLDQNQAKIQTYLSSEPARSPLRLVPDMDSGDEVYQSLYAPDLLKISEPLALIIGFSLFFTFAMIIAIHLKCSFDIGRQKAYRLTALSESCPMPSAPEVF